MRRAALALLLAFLLVPTAAGETGNPDRHEVAWHETMRAQGKVAMTFDVQQMHFQFAAWSAQIVFHNRSTKTLRIKPQFALLVSKTRTADASFRALLVERALPALPKELKPDARWRGIVSGRGRPRSGSFVRFNFGYFVVSGLFADRSRGFSWITDHVLKLEPRA